MTIETISTLFAVFLSESLCIVNPSWISGRRNDWANFKNQEILLKANYISGTSMESNYSISDLVYDLV